MRIFLIFIILLFLSNLTHTKEEATYFVVTWIAADIIGGRKGQGYQHKTQ